MLAVVALVYFINHRYDGTPLWDFRGVQGVHELVWILNFISFGFLYPSTFNLLEVGDRGSSGLSTFAVKEVVPLLLLSCCCVLSKK